MYYSGYTFAQLKPLLNLLLECCDDPRKHHSAVYNKYCDKRFKRAAAFVEGEVQRGFRLADPTSMKSFTPVSTQSFYDSVAYFPG